jgi:hypothetical protein
VELRKLSAQLAGLAPNGTAAFTSWGGILLRGTDPAKNIFQVPASAFTGAKQLSIEAPAGSLAVINIAGDSATFTGFGQSFSGGIDQHGVLFNFVEATSLTAHGYGFWGTVLAPEAHVQFSNGSFDGGIYARSMTGNAEGHLNGLDDHDICEPGLLFSGSSHARQRNPATEGAVRLQQRQSKVLERVERKRQKLELGARTPGGEAPDPAGIVPVPQALPQ